MLIKITRLREDSKITGFFSAASCSQTRWQEQGRIAFLRRVTRGDVHNLSKEKRKGGETVHNGDGVFLEQTSDSTDSQPVRGGLNLAEAPAGALCAHGVDCTKALRTLGVSDTK